MSAPAWRDPWAYVLALGYALVATLLLWPLANVAYQATTGGGEVSIWSDPSLGVALRHSLVVSALGALGATALGLPLALLCARIKIPASGLLTALATLCLLSPPFVGAYAWILLLGQQGVLRLLLADLGLPAPSIYGAFGIVIVFSTQYFPLVFLLTRGALEAQDPALEEAARSLGATGWRRLVRVTLPLVLPSLSGGMLLAFVMALANFGTPMVLGRNYRVLPTLAYDLFTSEVAQTQPDAAAGVCLLMILIASLALGLQKYVSGRRSVVSSSLRRTPPRALPGWRGRLAAFAAWGIVLGALTPLLTVVAFSFRNTNGPVFTPGVGLGSYRAVLHGVSRAIGNSLVYSLLAAIAIAFLGALLGAAIERRRGLASKVLDGLLLLPYLVPGLVLGIGFVLGFQSAPRWFMGSGAVLVFVYLIRRLPYAVRANTAILAQLDVQVEEAAKSLGASPIRAFFRATLPLMTPGVIAGAVLGWVTAIGELSATIVLYEGGTVTMPVQIYHQVMDGALGPAGALSTLLLGATGAALLLVERVRAERV
ncbi:MAG: iron ABC transporter permease [Planctomycetes bacterium]|nr:iron ABC transporter permease [Planctomycetota bacterium]